jgi:hypothetical protein
MVKSEYDNTYVEPTTICGKTLAGVVTNVQVDANGVVQTNATLSSATVTANQGDTIYTLSILPVTIAAAGNNTVIAAPGLGHQIKLYKLRLVANALVTMQYKSGASNISGPMYLLSISEDYDQYPITCGDNEAFIISLGDAISVNGYVVYRVT